MLHSVRRDSAEGLIWDGKFARQRSFDILGLAAKAPVDRTFVSMNLTETILAAGVKTQ